MYLIIIQDHSPFERIATSARSHSSRSLFIRPRCRNAQLSVTKGPRMVTVALDRAPPMISLTGRPRPSWPAESKQLWRTVTENQADRWFCWDLQNQGRSQTSSPYTHSRRWCRRRLVQPLRGSSSGRNPCSSVDWFLIRTNAKSEPKLPGG